MRIARIELYQVELPYSGGVYLLSGGREYRGFDAAIVRVVADDGSDGWGESTPFGSTYIAAHARGARAGIELRPGGARRGAVGEEGAEEAIAQVRERARRREIGGRDSRVGDGARAAAVAAGRQDYEREAQGTDRIAHGSSGADRWRFYAGTGLLFRRFEAGSKRGRPPCGSDGGADVWATLGRGGDLMANIVRRTGTERMPVTRRE